MLENYARGSHRLMRVGWHARISAGKPGPFYSYDGGRDRPLEAAVRQSLDATALAGASWPHCVSNSLMHAVRPPVSCRAAGPADDNSTREYALLLRRHRHNRRDAPAVSGSHCRFIDEKRRGFCRRFRSAHRDPSGCVQLCDVSTQRNHADLRDVGLELPHAVEGFLEMQRFGDKDGLFRDALSVYTERVLRRMNSARVDSARESVAAILRDFLPKPAASRRPAGCLLSRSTAELLDLAAAGKTTALAGVARQREIFADLLRQGVTNGEVAPGTDVDAFAWYYLGVLQAVLNLPQAGASGDALGSIIDVAMSAWPEADKRGSRNKGKAERRGG